jgi:hypothetical protein
MHDIPNTNCTHPAYNVPLIQINSLATVFCIANYDPDPTSSHSPDFPGPHSGPDTFMSLPKNPHLVFKVLTVHMVDTMYHSAVTAGLYKSVPEVEPYKSVEN